MYGRRHIDRKAHVHSVTLSVTRHGARQSCLRTQRLHLNNLKENPQEGKQFIQIISH